MTDATLDGASCINCGAPLNGPFCAQCGQRAASGPPTVRAFLHDASEELLGFERKLFRTLRALFLKPAS